MGQVTPTDRRAALRVGAGLVAGGVFVAACSGRGDAPRGERAGVEQAASSHASARPLAAVPVPRAFPRYPAQITEGPRTRPQVALTFHGAGDPAIARALLGEVERAGARVTVLAVGAWLDEWPEMGRRILDGGHEIGNHTQRHLGINGMAEGEARREIVGCAERLKRLTGGIGSWFRPSRAARASPLVVRLAREAGYPHVLSYGVDSLDFTSPGADEVARTVLDGVRPGAVVSLHFGYRDTVAALPVVLEELGRRGLRAVTTTELLS
ncbi:polysaccharide deacetylase family protein [Streptomyces roseirectus]|uniref:Polysaccharide deacetylase family protein n=1 Tax=Streptomyces roseirectus TaxID=2768066 RepID=A0A7H0IBA5_9ACTN|nr:polysaccharide deacetylase family protein [Streptomyces roseirectus]QNP70071.1 polysaccharide deacetylase family protein [Streptomyces roseirectus]